MTTNKASADQKLLYKELSYNLVGCFYEVYNQLGPGFKESVYHEALVVEFGMQGINYREEKQISIQYKNRKVGIYVPDFIIEDKILVEIKSVEFMPKLYEVQLYYYLKGSDFKLGYLVNFGGQKIDIRRRIFTKSISGDSL